MNDSTKPAWDLEDDSKGFFDATPDAMIVVGSDGTILAVNARAEELFKYERRALIGKNLEILIPANVRDQHREHVKSYSNDPCFRAMGSGLDLQACRSDGSTFAVDIALSHLHTSMGIVALASVRDATLQRKSQEELTEFAAELARSNEELEQFAYLAAHDLQSPMRRVATLCQMLEHKYRGEFGTTSETFIENIVGSAKQMQALINGLLDHSRVSHHRLRSEAIDCESLLKHVLKELDLLIQESRAEVTWDSLPTVVADRTQLAQLFRNLISNAIKYRRDQTPEVKIAGEPENNQWVFSVKDNGIGIEEKYTEEIFSLFHRLHSSSDHEGAGLGLAICRKVVERHGGRMWVDSQPGVGSTFYFTISEAGEGDQQ